MIRTSGAKRKNRRTWALIRASLKSQKSLEVVVHLNFSSGPRVKEIDHTNARSVIKNNNTTRRNNNHDRSRVGKVFRYYEALIYNGFLETSGKNGHYIFSRQDRSTASFCSSLRTKPPSWSLKFTKKLLLHSLTRLTSNRVISVELWLGVRVNDC